MFRGRCIILSIDYLSRTEEDVKNKVVIPLLRKHVYPYSIRELEKRRVDTNKLDRFKQFDNVVSYEKNIATGRTDIFILGGMIIVEIKRPSEEPDKYREQINKYVQPNTICLWSCCFVQLSKNVLVCKGCAG